MSEITSPTAGTAKSIILFSDGTGNSSAKLFKTNVWRLYEAVDLGPASPGKRPQIAFYDNGVGTSALRPLSLLAGIFGFGLKRNILEIYRYACRNYAPAAGQLPGQPPVEGGDELYGFGFSRGAFTMRLVIALIASQGLVVSDGEDDLARKSDDAFRAFRAAFEPRLLQGPTRLYRRLRQRFVAWRRERNGLKPYDPGENYRPIIRFVGVWDTVAAYGGPISEITRAIDNWLYALSMPDYKLDPAVRRARHALAIDDERDAFHPLLWDEMHEQELVKAEAVAPDRLRQVWFTGMHADVGGGYPDESLSYVSLLWMLTEANDSGLRTLEIITERFRALASSSGPLHNSRSGPGAYYRYQPRKIAAWVHPPDPATRFQQDPDRVDRHGDPVGFIPTAQIHESVAARIAFGTDRYSPITLPVVVAVVPPHPGGETALQRDNVTPEVKPGQKQASYPLLSPELRRRFEDASFGAERVGRMEAVWDLVWRRRILYFVSVALTLLLAFMPLWIDRMPPPPLLADGRTWLSAIIRLPELILPEFLHGWVETLAGHSFYVLALAIGLFFTLSYSSRLERRLRDHSRKIWEHCLNLSVTTAEKPEKLPWRLRRDGRYQALMQAMKWTYLPFAIGLIMGAVLAWAVLSAVTQAWLPRAENNGTLCPKRNGAAAELRVARFDFSPASLCHSTGLRVRQNDRYIVDLEVVRPWRDGSQPTAPTGLTAGEIGLPAGWAGVPLRRIVNARYLQPAYLIRTQRKWWQLSNSAYIQPLELVPVGDGATAWQAEFTAARDGELSLFANDSMLPRWLGLDHTYFYTRTGSGKWRGNTGTACVTIRRADLVDAPPLAAPAPGSACATASARAALAAEAENQAVAAGRAYRARKQAQSPPADD
ncbi:MAG TPA: DUF2235 domain-containing protein [Croceibacterium sp.]|nr:DUF2235 domain-containing protein [Croceibacterium sp.]